MSAGTLNFTFCFYTTNPSIYFIDVAEKLRCKAVRELPPSEHGTCDGRGHAGVVVIGGSTNMFKVKQFVLRELLVRKGSLHHDCENCTFVSSSFAILV